MILPESIGWCGIMGGYGGGNQDFNFETELTEFYRIKKTGGEATPD
jgi:hypothetical protein